MKITLIDWIIFTALTSGLLAVGYWTKYFTRGVADFTVAGRKLRMWLGLSAASADGVAIVSIVVICQEAYTHGFSFAWLRLIPVIVGAVVIGTFGFGIKRYRATGVQTLPQYYEMRYSKGVRIFAGIALVIGGVLNMAVFPDSYSSSLITSSFFKRRSSCNSRVKNLDCE